MTELNAHLEALRGVLAALPDDAAARLAGAIGAHKRVFLYGAGRSGLMLKAFAMRLAQAGYTVYAVGEVVTPALEAGDLLLMASASGKTDSVLRYAQIAKQVGALLFGITASPESPLAACADDCLVLPAPTKHDAAAGSLLGTLFEQALLLFCDRVVLTLGSDPSVLRARHANLE